MHSIIVICLALHVLSSVFWAGSTFTLARTQALLAERLFKPQMGAAAAAVITGVVLWHTLHKGGFGTPEQILAAGAACAIIAALIQGVSKGLSSRKADSGQATRLIVIGQRAAAALLAVTVVCMAVAKYV